MKNIPHIILILLVILLAVSCARKTAVSATFVNAAIKVMTYNTHHCNPPDKPGIIDVDAVAAAIKKEQPDIVALQEIDINTGRSGKINEVELLAVKAGYTSFYFAKTIDFDGGQYGIAILSKYPLSGMKKFELPTDETAGGEHRVLAMGTVTLPGDKKLRFACTHLDAESNDASRLLQIKEIGRLTSDIPTPLVIAGDFNATENSEVIKILDGHFTRTCQSCAPTLQEDGHDIAIDFIAYKPAAGFMVQSHKVLQDVKVSDHYPVVSVLRYNF